MKKQKLVTIIVPTFNHEKYIEQALDSILMQVTNFEYIVYIGEDNSEDNTRKVLKDIEKKYPSNFVFVYREKNIGAYANLCDLWARVDTPYFITLEGDDYWIDPYKLQKQVDFLEEHKEFWAVTHDVVMVDKESKKIDMNYPTIRTGVYKIENFLEGLLPGQTAAKLIRREFLEIRKHFRENTKFVNYPGDQRDAYLYAVYEKIYCIPEQMSAYRFVNDEGSSYVATYKMDDVNAQNKIQFFENIYEYSKQYVKNDKVIQLMEQMFLLNLIKYYRVAGYSVKYVIKKYQTFSYKKKAVCYVEKRIMQSLKRKVSKKEMENFVKQKKR